jgi:muramoyltetrapeptide carboxypeptidase LdcA involved in peptidoglycan recycling
MQSGMSDAEEILPRNIAGGTSEVARLLRQIDREYEAAKQGLVGLSQGCSSHSFIIARMDQVTVYHEQLTTQVGETEATRLIYEHYVEHIG